MPVPWGRHFRVRVSGMGQGVKACRTSFGHTAVAAGFHRQGVRPRAPSRQTASVP